MEGITGTERSPNQKVIGARLCVRILTGCYRKARLSITKAASRSTAIRRLAALEIWPSASSDGLSARLHEHFLEHFPDYTSITPERITREATRGDYFAGIGVGPLDAEPL